MKKGERKNIRICSLHKYMKYKYVKKSSAVDENVNNPIQEKINNQEEKAVNLQDYYIDVDANGEIIGKKEFKFNETKQTRFDTKSSSNQLEENKDFNIVEANNSVKKEKKSPFNFSTKKEEKPPVTTETELGGNFEMESNVFNETQEDLSIENSTDFSSFDIPEYTTNTQSSPKKEKKSLFGKKNKKRTLDDLDNVEINSFEDLSHFEDITIQEEAPKKEKKSLFGFGKKKSRQIDEIDEIGNLDIGNLSIPDIEQSEETPTMDIPIFSDNREQEETSTLEDTNVNEIESIQEENTLFGNLNIQEQTPVKEKKSLFGFGKKKSRQIDEIDEIGNLDIGNLSIPDIEQPEETPTMETTIFSDNTEQEETPKKEKKSLFGFGKKKTKQTDNFNINDEIFTYTPEETPTIETLVSSDNVEQEETPTLEDTNVDNIENTQEDNTLFGNLNIQEETPIKEKKSLFSFGKKKAEQINEIDETENSTVDNLSIPDIEQSEETPTIETLVSSDNVEQEETPTLEDTNVDNIENTQEDILFKDIDIQEEAPKKEKKPILFNFNKAPAKQIDEIDETESSTVDNLSIPDIEQSEETPTIETPVFSDNVEQEETPILEDTNVDNIENTQEENTVFENVEETNQDDETDSTPTTLSEFSFTQPTKTSLDKEDIPEYNNDLDINSIDIQEETPKKKKKSLFGKKNKKRTLDELDNDNIEISNNEDLLETPIEQNNSGSIFAAFGTMNTKTKPEKDENEQTTHRNPNLSYDMFNELTDESLEDEESNVDNLSLDKFDIPEIKTNNTVKKKTLFGFIPLGKSNKSNDTTIQIADIEDDSNNENIPAQENETPNIIENNTVSDNGSIFSGFENPTNPTVSMPNVIPQENSPIPQEINVQPVMENNKKNSSNNTLLIIIIVLAVSLLTSITTAIFMSALNSKNVVTPEAPVIDQTMIDKAVEEALNKMKDFNEINNTTSQFTTDKSELPPQLGLDILDTEKNNSSSINKKVFSLGNISFSYPAEWIDYPAFVMKSTPENISNIVMIGNGSDSYKTMSNMRITTETLIQSISAKDYVDKTEEILKENFKNLKTRESKELTVAGREAPTRIYTFEQDGNIYYQYQVYVADKTKIYIISFTSAEKTFEENYKIYNDILTTMRL